VQDLNLDQMFEVFDAADKGKSFTGVPPPEKSSSAVSAGEGSGAGAAVPIGILALAAVIGFAVTNLSQ
jgi:hypothetical protein